MDDHRKTIGELKEWAKEVNWLLLTHEEAGGFEYIVFLTPLGKIVHLVAKDKKILPS